MPSPENGACALTDEQKQEIERILDYLYSFVPKGKEQLLDQMVLMSDKNSAQIHMFVNKLENFLISLVSHPKPLVRKDVSDSTDAQTYRTIVAELNAYVESRIPTKEIAEKLHCSPENINRVFARYSDIGVHKYLLKLKIAAAIRMLRKNTPVSETSARLGFFNQNYFSSAFKRETGSSPTQYMQRIADPTLLF